MVILLIGILLSFFGCILSYIFNKKIKIKLFSFFLFISSVVFIIAIVNLLFFNFSKIFDRELVKKISLLENFEVNKIGLFFIFILSLVSLSISFYIPYYVKSHEISEVSLNFHFINFTILINSIVLLFISNNFFMFLILWELMGLSSFFCIFFDGKKEKTINAAIQYIIMMHISFIFIAIAVMLSYKYTGSFSFNVIRNFFNQNGEESLNKMRLIIFSFFTIGFFIKLGIFPFHFWLPEAHPASPSHVSSFMSSIVIKTGLFGLILILSIFGVPSQIHSILLMFIGLFSALIGIINAASQKDIKKFLAYSSVENAGILLFLYASTLFAQFNKDPFLLISSFIALLVYLLNHALSKSSAFLSAGIIIKETGKSSLDMLSGLVHLNKSLSGAGFLSSISLSALPPFGNFIGELIVLIAYSKYIINGNFSIIPFAIFLFLGLIGAITVLSFTKYYSTGFLGNYKGVDYDKKSKLSILTSISIYIALVFALILSSPYFYQNYFNLFNDVMRLGINFEYFDLISSCKEQMIFNLTKFYKIMIFFVISIITTSILYSFISVKKSKTWGCGYIEKDKDNFQYSSTSFVQPFINIFKPLTGIKTKQKKEGNLFTKESYMESEHHDIIHKGILTPIIEKLRDFFERFTFIQSGRTQDYILFGLIFLVVIIIITLMRYM